MTDNTLRMKDFVVCAIDGCESLISHGNSKYCKPHQVEMMKHRHCPNNDALNEKRNYTQTSLEEKERRQLDWEAWKIARHERSIQHQREYQHEYYLRVTKPRRHQEANAQTD